jgi:hypothetical protein
MKKIFSKTELGEAFKTNQARIPYQQNKPIVQELLSMSEVPMM